MMISIRFSPLVSFAAFLLFVSASACAPKGENSAKEDNQEESDEEESDSSADGDDDSSSKSNTASSEEEEESEADNTSENDDDSTDDESKSKDDSNSDSSPEKGTDSNGSPIVDGLPDMKHVELLVDLESKTAQATVQFSVGKKVTHVRFEVGDLEDVEVFFKKKPLRVKREGKSLRVELPKLKDKSYHLDFEYAYKLHEEWKGVMNTGTTMLWPYHCGNVYPCRSHPIDGVKYSLELMEAKDTAVFAKNLDAEAPAYQMAWSVGDYKKIDRGETPAGTKVEVWHFAGREAEAEKGTKNLKEYVAWFEATYGDYMFGDRVASVEANWGGDTPYGGMEHHPMWHVSKGSFAEASVHAHEAAHGWFGDGIRIKCWGDFVLSEGTVSYLTARAIEAVDGKQAGQKVWSEYIQSLKSALPKAKVKKAWHPGCEDIDINDGYFSAIPYKKGALFFRALERAVGREQLDAALRETYSKYKGKSATFGDLLDVVKKITNFDPMPCAKVWLRRDKTPDLDASCKELK